MDHASEYFVFMKLLMQHLIKPSNRRRRGVKRWQISKPKTQIMKQCGPKRIKTGKNKHKEEYENVQDYVQR